MLILNISRIIRSYMQLLFYLILFPGKLRLRSFVVYFGKNFTLNIHKNCSLELKGKLVCRNNIYIDIKDGGKLTIGKNTFLNNACSINTLESINIGNDCMLGENVKIYDHDYNLEKGELYRKSSYTKKAIIIEDNVWIGSNCTILKGVTIGSNSVIAAGTIVNKNILPNSKVYDKRDQTIIKEF